MLIKIWESDPTKTSKYTPDTCVFEKLEDIRKSEEVSRITDDRWIKYTSAWKWPGPEVKVVEGPEEIPPLFKVRGIPQDSIKLEIKEAYEIADRQLKKHDCGDRFTGTIILYWPLFPKIKEPYYSFHTNLDFCIRVGAYSGLIYDNAD